METITHGQIVKLIKLPNSRMGNPKYKLRIYTPVETFDAVTATDAGFAYAITDRYIGKWADIELSGAVRQRITDIALEDKE